MQRRVIVTPKLGSPSKRINGRTLERRIVLPFIRNARSGTGQLCGKGRRGFPTGGSLANAGAVADSCDDLVTHSGRT